MKIAHRRNFPFQLLLILAYFLIVPYQSSAETKTKVVLASDPWCPFFCASTEPTGPGILTEIINEALMDSEFKLETKEINWARAQDLANKGETNGVIGAYKEDVPGFTYTAKPLYNSKDCFYTMKKQNWKYTDLNSLKGKRVGIVNSYSYGAKVDEFKTSEAGKQIFIEVSGDVPLDQNFKKLEADRLDLLLENQAVVNFRKKKDTKFAKLESLGCGDQNGVYALFNPKLKDNAKVVKLLNVYLASPKGQKRIAAIIKKYLN